MTRLLTTILALARQLSLAPKRTLTLALTLSLSLTLTLQAQSYPLDSIALLDVDSNTVRLAELHSDRALVLIFTGNHCVYSKKYEDRLIALATTYASQQVRFLLVNSNNPDLSPDDRFALMQARAREKHYPCAYIHDPAGRLARMAGATKNPEAFIFVHREGAWALAYSGKIDDNPLMDTRVQEHYLRAALDAILAGKPAASTQPAVGCNIKQ